MVEKTANYLLSVEVLNRLINLHLTCQFHDCQTKYFKCKRKPLAVFEWMEKCAKSEGHKKIFWDFL